MDVKTQLLGSNECISCQTLVLVHQAEENFLFWDAYVLILSFQILIGLPMRKKKRSSDDVLVHVTLVCESMWPNAKTNEFCCSIR